MYPEAAVQMAEAFKKMAESQVAPSQVYGPNTNTYVD